MLLVAVVVLVGAGVARWLQQSGKNAFEWAMAGAGAPLAVLATLYLTSLPGGFALLAGVAALAVACEFRRAVGQPENLPREAWGATGLISLVCGIWLLTRLGRPPGPLYWDEFVWLSKSRLEATGFGALARGATIPSAGVFPAGYPTLYSAGAAWLAAGRASIADLHAGMSAWMTVALLAFVSVSRLLAGNRTAWGSLWPLLTALTAPIVLIHVRSCYADLVIGLLGATLSVTLLSLRGVVPGQSGHAGWIACATAVVLVGLKDEGIVHVASASVVAWAWRGPVAEPSTVPAQRWRVVLPLACAAVAWFAWRLALARGGVRNTDHAVVGVAWNVVPRLANEVARHLQDFRTWGLFWFAAIAAVLATISLPQLRRSSALPLGVTFVLTGMALTAGIVAGTERVQAFALGGTLIHRLLVQLAPTAALSVTAAVIALR